MQKNSTHNKLNLNVNVDDELRGTDNFMAFSPKQQQGYSEEINQMQSS